MLVVVEKIFTRSIIWMAVGFFIIGALLYSFQIAARLLFQDSFFWIDALISYLFTIAALMGSALAVRDRENIKIDILRRYSEKPEIRLITDGFSALVIILLLIIFFLHTGRLYSSSTLSVFGAPEWFLNIPYLILFTGSLVYYGQLLNTDFRNWRDKNRIL